MLYLFISVKFGVHLSLLWSCYDWTIYWIYGVVESAFLLRLGKQFAIFFDINTKWREKPYNILFLFFLFFFRYWLLTISFARLYFKVWQIFLESFSIFIKGYRMSVVRFMTRIIQVKCNVQVNGALDNNIQFPFSRYFLHFLYVFVFYMFVCLFLVRF